MSPSKRATILCSSCRKRCKFCSCRRWFAWSLTCHLQDQGRSLAHPDHHCRVETWLLPHSVSPFGAAGFEDITLLRGPAPGTARRVDRDASLFRRRKGMLPAMPGRHVAAALPPRAVRPGAALPDFLFGAFRTHYVDRNSVLVHNLTLDFSILRWNAVPEMSYAFTVHPPIEFLRVLCGSCTAKNT